ncbi:MAG: hypothetical protein MJZ23_10355 [Paludibacteraceae bacterium]|nr:hypothetical protein [Paludibacteraceae bacterium]
MKKLLLLALPLLAMAVSCSNDCEEDFVSEPNVDEGYAYIHSSDSIDKSLRTTFTLSDDVYHCQWTLVDSFALCDSWGTKGSIYSNAKYSIPNKFARVGGDRPKTDPGTVYYTYYPAKGYRDWLGNGTMKIALPDTQYYNPNGTVSEEAYPIYGMTEKAGEWHFYNAASFVVLRLKTNIGIATVKTIRLSADNNLSGSAAVTVSKENIKPTLVMDETEVGNSRKVVLNCGKGVGINSTNLKFFYVVIPYGTHKNLNIEVELAEGYKQKKFVAELPILRSQFRSTTIDMEIQTIERGYDNENNEHVD